MQKMALRPPAPHRLAFPTVEPEAVAEELRSSLSTGLTEQEAASRLESWGRNIVEDVRPPGPLRLLVEQFADPLVLLLLAAAARGPVPAHDQRMRAPVFGRLGAPLLATQILWVNLGISCSAAGGCRSL